MAWHSWGDGRAVGILWLPWDTSWFATFTSLESGILVGGTSALNFAMTGVAFEVGAVGGSLVSAIPAGSGNTVSDLLTNCLFKEFGPDASNIPELACGW
jgi:hypothetical protein